MKKDEELKNRVLAVFQACRDGLIRSITKMSVAQQDVDDILQEAFIRVMHSEQKHKIESLNSYLFVVSRNLVLKKLTQQSRDIHTELDEAILSNETKGSLENELYQKRRLERLNQLLYELPEEHRRAILFRKLYCLSYKEIARKMNVSVSSVEKYIALGLKACKQSLHNDGYSATETKIVAGSKLNGNDEGRSAK